MPPLSQPPAEIRLRKRPPRASGPKKKPRGMPIKKGEVLNVNGAGGRPRTRWLPTMELPKGTREAFTVLSDRAFEALADILEDNEHPRHEQAIEYVLNQKWGTARQTVDMNNPDGNFGGKHELVISFVKQDGPGVVVQRIGSQATAEAMPGKAFPAPIEATATPQIALPPVCLPPGPWDKGGDDRED